MLIRQPEDHLPIRRRTHVIPRIPLHHARAPLARQPAHWFDLLGLHLYLALRVPHDRVPVAPAAPDQIASVGAETHVALAQCPGGPRRRAQVRRRVRALAVRAQRAVEGVQQQVALRVVGGEQEGFAVVGELEPGPVRFGGLHLRGGEVGPHVEGGEGGFVVVAQVVEEDRVRGGGGDGDDRRGGVVGGEVGGREVQARLRGGRGQRPEAHGVVERGREERVRRRAQAERRDGLGVAPEVAQEGVVVRGEVADAVVLLGAGVDDGGGVVREARQVDAVFLAHERFDVPPFFGVVEQEGVVRAGGQAEFARVVKVERRDRGLGFGEFELLVREGSALWSEEWEGGGGKMAEVITLVGRKVPMTSEVFCVSCGPPGGGGGTTRGPAIVSVLGQRWISKGASSTDTCYPWW